MGDRMAMTPVCFKYWISGIMPLWASAICVCWMHIWGIKVRQEYFSVWYRHGICFLNVDCTLSLSILLRQMSKLLCLYMKYVCIYTCIYMHISMGWCGGDMAPVRLRWRCACLALTCEIYKCLQNMSMCWCRRGVDLLPARWGCVFLALAHQCDPI